jgi:hypothetical protein
VDTIPTSIFDDPIAQLILNGEAENPSEAERMYLDRNLYKVVDLVNSPLTDDQFRDHPLIRLLFSHGSRGWEDSLM